MPADARLRSVALFSSLGEDDLDRICQGVIEVTLDAGEVLFNEGDPGESAYVVADGEVEILKATARRDIRLAVRGPNEVFGEIALLYQDMRTATVRARVPTTLLSIPKSVLDELLSNSPSAARTLFQTLGERLRENHQESQQGERMAQLGTLAVGIAHELNNPAAGVQRAADQLRTEFERLAQDIGAHAATTSEEAFEVAKGRRRAAELTERLADRRDEASSLTGMQRNDLEEEFEEWLEGRDVPDAWQLAPGLVDAGLHRDDLEGLADETDKHPAMSSRALSAALRFIVGSSRMRQLTESIVEGSARLSSIVSALKRHNYTDQAPLVQVDVVRGLQDTLLLLGHKAKQVTVVREYEEDLPTIEGYGSDLNQVWTNLIDNACDALLDSGTPSPTLTVVARRTTSGDGIIVEIRDNGPGIPDDVRDRIFDAFFTTKEPGKGTGLGLQISARIVYEHDGDLRVTSQPGKTTFHVELPLRLPTNEGVAIDQEDERADLPTP